MSLWRFATDEIRAAESRLGELGWYDDGATQLSFWTGANDSPIVPIEPGVLVWERLQLSDGTLARLVTSLDPPASEYFIRGLIVRRVPNVGGMTTSWARIALLYAIGVLAAGQLGIVPPLVPALQRDLGLSLATAGMAVSVVTLVGAVLGLPAGGWSQRIGHGAGARHRHPDHGDGGGAVRRRRRCRHAARRPRGWRASAICWSSSPGPR